MLPPSPYYQRRLSSLAGRVPKGGRKQLFNICQFKKIACPQFFIFSYYCIVLIVSFLTVVRFGQGWYIVTYALGIYHLNLFIAFLSPKIDPAMSDFEESEDGPELPTKANEEFRPFIRRLPEFKFWYSVSKSTVIAVFCTFFEVFNVPVFWPILVMYFITLFCLTMKRQIKHMIKYRYIPFTHGKPKYQVDHNKGAIPKK
nr:EOG090X0FVI [Ceriodaphnia reticulata]